MKTSMIATVLVASALAGMTGVGYLAGVARTQAAAKAALPKSGDQPPKAGAAGPKLSVLAVQLAAVNLREEYACRVQSHHRISIRAPIKGYLASIPVKGGQAVKAGDLLFKIAALGSQARRDVELAERNIAQLEYSNTKRLYDQKQVSQNEVQLAGAKLDRAKAKADLAEAELGEATIRAPFGGIIDRLHDQEGGLVKDGDTLTTLSDNSVMWAYFNVPDGRYLESMAERRADEASPAVELILSDRRKFPQPGKIGAIDANFNNETGTIAFRADFPNPDGILRHGQSGTVSINRVLKDAIVIPRRATIEADAKRYVYVVGKDDVAHKREIAIQHEVDDVFVVKAGVGVGDKIVGEGATKVHDGDKVKY